MPIRRLVPLIAAAMLASIPWLALAHAELASAEPASGAALDEPPAEVVLTFDGELDPDRSGFTVTDADANEVGTGEVDLEVADRNVLRGDVSIIDGGVYTVEWTAVAGDGHPESGSYQFRVGPATVGHPSPDTAVPRSAPVVAAGVAFVALAIMLGIGGVRRGVRR